MPAGALVYHWALIALVLLGAVVGLRRGWPRETLSLVALLAARALSHASPERVRAAIDTAWRAAGDAIGALAHQAGQSPPAGVPAPVDLSAPDAQTLAVFSVACWLVSLPLARLLFPDRPRGLGALLGVLLGAANGALLALALVPLLPDDGVAALPERWLMRASGPWFEQYFPPLVVGGSLIIGVVALISGALPQKPKQRRGRT